jgi:hypothetical protein
MTIGFGVRTAAIALALSALAGAACAAGSVTATAPASVTVMSATTLTKTQDMAFGQVVRPSNANTNTVTLDANDTVTLSGAGNGSAIAGGTTSAKFNLNAPAGTTYSTVQSLSFTQTGLTNIAPSLPTATNGVLGTVPASGVQELRFGGSFDMTSATPAQAYTGTLSVTVNYN